MRKLEKQLEFYDGLTLLASAFAKHVRAIFYHLRNCIRDPNLLYFYFLIVE